MSKRLLCLFVLTILLLQDNPGIAQQPRIEAHDSSMAVGGSVTNSTISIGLSGEQLRRLTEAAVKGATEPLVGEISALAKRLDITEAAVKTLLRIVGERTDVPDEQLAEVLAR